VIGRRNVSMLMGCGGFGIIMAQISGGQQVLLETPVIGLGILMEHTPRYALICGMMSLAIKYA
jgi:hypothetical protein